LVAVAGRTWINKHVAGLAETQAFRWGQQAMVFEPWLATSHFSEVIPHFAVATNIEESRERAGGVSRLG